MGVRRRSGAGDVSILLAVVIGVGLCLTGCGATPASQSDVAQNRSATPSTQEAVVSTSMTITAVARHTSGGMEVAPHRNKYGSGLTSVSCPVALYCVASDGSGFIYTLAKGRWSRGIRVAGGTTILNAVSCATTSFCAAVGGSTTGGWYTYNFSHGSWRLKTPTPTAGAGYGFFSVSCPTATFCAAVPGPGLATFSGGRWSSGPEPPGIPAPSSLDLISVSCPSRSFCVALGLDRGDGVYALTLTNGAWSSPPQGIDLGREASVSCATATAHRGPTSLPPYAPARPKPRPERAHR